MSTPLEQAIVITFCIAFAYINYRIVKKGLRKQKNTDEQIKNKNARRKNTS